MAVHVIAVFVALRAPVAYEQVYRRHMAAERTLGAAVLVAISSMASRPFA